MICVGVCINDVVALGGIRRTIGKRAFIMDCYLLLCGM